MKKERQLLRVFMCSIFFTISFAAFAQTLVGDTIYHYGYKLIMSEDGNRVAVGWYEDTGYLEPTPRVNVYEWSGTAWIELGGGPSFVWGYGDSPNMDISMSDDGNRVTIVTTTDYDTATNTYTTRTSEWNGSSWNIISEGLITQGSSVSLSGDGNRLAIGNPNHPYPRKGEAAVYERNGGNWDQMGSTFAGTYDYQSLGFVSLSEDGMRLALTSSYEITYHADGFTQIYEWNGAGWEELGGVIFPSERFVLAANGQSGVSSYHEQLQRYEWNGDSWMKNGDPIAGNKIYLSNNGNRLITDAGNTYQWVINDWQEIVPAPISLIRAIDIAGDGSRMVVSAGGRTMVYDFDDPGFVYELPVICSNEEPVTFTQAFFPAGGVLSGPGVTLGDEPGSFVLEPALAGTGTHGITYALDGEIFSTSVTIAEPVAPSLSLDEILVINNPNLIHIPGAGVPTGGYYEDDQGYLIDDGNGLTFSVDGLEEMTETTITYTAADDNGCMSSISQTVLLVDESINGGNPYPEQLGSDQWINDLNGSYGFSVSLSADGKRMAVGAPKVGLGEVYVYERLDSDWVQMGEKITGQLWWGSFGHEVKITDDGNYLFIGTPELANPAVYSQYPKGGSIQLYRRSGSNWIFVDKWEVNLEKHFGRSIGISGDGSRIVVSGPDINDGPERAFLLSRTPAGFDYEGYVESNNDTDSYGNALALSADGTRFIVGESESFAGTVHIYDWSGGGSAILYGDVEGSQFGSSVAITEDGNRIVVGAPQTNASDNLGGYVRTYKRQGENWVPTGPSLTGGVPGERFGTSVSLSRDGSYLLVGAPGNDNPGENTGRTVLYAWNGSGWEEFDEILPGGNQTEDQFGFAVAIAADSNVVAVGAPQQNAPLSSGYVRIFGFGELEGGFQTTVKPAPILFETIPDLGGGGIPFESPFTGMVDLSLLGIEVFPNPTAGTLYLRGNDVQSVQLMDQAGLVLWKHKGATSKIDLTNLPAGVYYLRIELPNGQIGGRQIIKG